MKNSNKIFNQIKSEIYKESEKTITKEQGFDNIKKIRDIRGIVNRYI